MHCRCTPPDQVTQHFVGTLPRMMLQSSVNFDQLSSPTFVSIDLTPLVETNSIFKKWLVHWHSMAMAIDILRSHVAAASSDLAWA